MQITQITKVLLLTVIISFLSLVSQASHVPGGNISYEYIGNGQYVVTLTLYEDCGTAFIGNSSEDIDITNDCGFPDMFNVDLPIITYQQEISQLCDAQLGQSECNGGNLPGVYMHVWQDTITLPGNCDSWTFSYQSCCRNTSNNLVGSSDDYYFQAILNSTTSPTNSSPFITNQPIPYVCVNQPVVYNMGAYEPDGNTLVYSLVDALQDANSSVSYQGGFSGATPIPGITIDAATGEVNFTPTTTGNYVVAILIEEFDNNGALVGSFVQDFQVEVINCSGNTAPIAPASISNFSGTGLQTGNLAIQMCEGDNVCFDVTFTDANTGDSIFLESNVATAFPGATFTQNTFMSPATATICLLANPGSNPFTSISITAKDNACPIFGTTSMIVEATVVTSTYAGPDQIMCLGAGAQLQASGGSVFNWNVISGDPITGTNFSCNPCDNPVANPSVTTTYEVVSNLAAGCNNRDTVTITVVPDFTYTITQTSPTACLNSPVQIDVTPTPAGNYTYLWTPNANISDPTVNNPVITPVSSGNYQYNVTITSDQGCVKQDSAMFTIIAEVAPTLTVTTNTTTAGCGDTVFFDLDLGGGIPAMCGASANTTCAGGGSTNVLGSNDGDNSSTGYPAPFGNWYRNAKHQFLYTAAELNAMGFAGGKITQISFNVSDMNNSTTNYNNYSISMGCTGTTSLSTWETGLTEVFSPQNITVGMGWNDFALTSAYEWDGVSNLVIQICFDNLNVTYTQNASSPYTNTSFTSALYYRSDGTLACPYTGSPSTSTKRPLTKFVHCPTTPDPAAYSYAWTPTGEVVQGNTQLEYYTIPATTTDYHIVVTNIAGGCADSADINVIAHCLKPLPTITSPTCNGMNDGEISVNIIGSDGPQWIVELINSNGAVIETQTTMLDSVIFDTLTAGQYVVRLTDTLGLTADTIITITEPSPVVVTEANDTIICIGGTANLYASASGGNGVNSYVYYWSGNGLGNTANETVTLTDDSTFNVYVLDSLGCSSDTVDINISTFPPILTTTNITDTVCPNLPATLTVSANGGHGGAYNYDWKDENGATIGSGSSISVTPSSVPATYYVEVTDDCTTPMKLDSVTVYWYDELQVDFTSDKDSGCYPVQIIFNNLTPTGQVSSLNWEFGDGATATNDPNPTHVYSAPGIYDVKLTVTSPDGCIADTTIVNMIKIYDYPVADYSSAPNPANIFNSTVEFTNESSSDAIVFEWFFYDSTLMDTTHVENPEYKFSTQAPFVYPVELVVTNQHGCTDTIIKDVIVNGVYTFYAPSAFTPNNDGINDLFYTQGEGVETTDFSLMIFDRDGRIVFETSSFTEQWDGTKNGQVCPQGVYVWKIKTLDKFEGIPHEYYGYVTLLR